MCALAERDLQRRTERYPGAAERQPGASCHVVLRSFGEGLLARMMKDEAKAHAGFTKRSSRAGKDRASAAKLWPTLCVLALIDAALGRKEEALREGRHAIELMPAEKDSVQGAHIIDLFAVIAAWVGEKDLACEQLALCFAISRCARLRRIQTAPLLGRAARRSALRENRRLPRAERLRLRRDPRFEVLVKNPPFIRY